jgi:hypothetical protein
LQKKFSWKVDFQSLNLKIGFPGLPDLILLDIFVLGLCYVMLGSLLSCELVFVEILCSLLFEIIILMCAE